MTKIRAAVVQTDPVFGEVNRNVERALARIPAACDLAVLPELFATGYQMRSRAEGLDLAEPIPAGVTCQRLLTFARDTGTVLVAGLAERADDRLYNSAVLVRPDGTWGLYRKLHLFWDEKTIFDPGDLGLPVFTACGTSLGMMICFDWIFPEAARTLALRGAQLICHPSNLVLPHCPQSMLVRALENRVFTLTANRVGSEHRTDARLDFIGRSRIVAPSSEVVASCGDTEPEVAVAELDLTRWTKAITPRNDVFADRRPEFYESGL